MSYKNLEKFVNDKKIATKEKIKPSKKFNTLSRSEKDDLLEKILIDFGYIDGQSD